METYRLTVGSQELLGALSDYLTLKKNKPIKVKEKHGFNYIGYQEDENVEVKIYYEETIEILGHVATKTVEISKDDIKTILDELLKEKGYYVQKISFQSGAREVGDYRDRYNEPYFDGVELSIAEIQKELKKKMG